MLTDSDWKTVLALLGQLANPSLAASQRDRRRIVANGLSAILQASGWRWLMVAINGDPSDHPLSIRFLEADTIAFDEGNAVASDHHGGLLSALIVRARQTITNTARCCTVTCADIGDAAASQDFASANAVVGQVAEPFLAGVYQVNPNCVSILSLHRPGGTAVFGQRDQIIMQLVLEHLDWLHDEGHAIANNRSVHLSPRERQVLASLLQGASRKRIADEMQLSEYTVAGYMKEIYRKFGVGSHPELLALFLHGPVDRIG